jgi:hypothetical protein
VSKKPALSEDEFQTGVIEYAKLTGWRVFHVSDSRREVIDRKRGVSRLVGDELAKGWPDLVLCHPGRGLLLYRELKSDKGTVTRDQKRWLEDLAATGADVGVWRPRDLPAIQRALQGKTNSKEAA